MPGEKDRTGEFAFRLEGLECDMEKLKEATMGDGPTSLKTRVAANEEEKRVRVATLAAIGTMLAGFTSLVFWVVGSGVIERVDALREDFRTMKRAAVVRPVEVPR